MSWPVSVRAVAASRVFSMYAYNFIYALLLLLPAGVVYAVKANPEWWFYPLYLVLMLLIPAWEMAVLNRSVRVWSSMVVYPP